MLNGIGDDIVGVLLGRQEIGWLAGEIPAAINHGGGRSEAVALDRPLVRRYERPMPQGIVIFRPESSSGQAFRNPVRFNIPITFSRAHVRLSWAGLNGAHAAIPRWRMHQTPCFRANRPHRRAARAAEHQPMGVVSPNGEAAVVGPGSERETCFRSIGASGKGVGGVDLVRGAYVDRPWPMRLRTAYAD